MIKLKELLTEGKAKPSFIKKAQAILQKELGGNIEVIDAFPFPAGNGNALRLSGKDHGLYVDYSKHPLYGDTFEIYVVKKDGFPTGGSAAHIDADSEKDALKAVMMLGKKQKKLLQK